MHRLELRGHTASLPTSPFYQPPPLHATPAAAGPSSSSSSRSAHAHQHHHSPPGYRAMSTPHQAPFFGQPPPLAIPGPYLSNPSQPFAGSSSPPSSSSSSSSSSSPPKMACGGPMGGSSSGSSSASSASLKSRPKMPIKKSRSEQAKQRAVQASLENKVVLSRGFAFFVPLCKTVPPAPPTSPVLSGRPCGGTAAPFDTAPAGFGAGNHHPDYFGAWERKGEERWVENMHGRGGAAGQHHRTGGANGESGDSCEEGSMDVDSP